MPVPEERSKARGNRPRGPARLSPSANTGCPTPWTRRRSRQRSRLLLAFDVLMIGLHPVLTNRILRRFQRDRLVADELMQLHLERLLLLGAHVLARRHRPEILRVVAAAQRDRDE